MMRQARATAHDYMLTAAQPNGDIEGIAGIGMAHDRDAPISLEKAILVAAYAITAAIDFHTMTMWKIHEEQHKE